MIGNYPPKITPINPNYFNCVLNYSMISSKFIPNPITKNNKKTNHLLSLIKMKNKCIITINKYLIRTPNF